MINAGIASFLMHLLNIAK